VPILLRLHWLRRAAQAQSKRLLSVLFLRIGAMPADSGGALLASQLRAAASNFKPYVTERGADYLAAVSVVRPRGTDFEGYVHRHAPGW
jgi:hypothetical protein